MRWWLLLWGGLCGRETASIARVGVDRRWQKRLFVSSAGNVSKLAGVGEKILSALPQGVKREAESAAERGGAVWLDVEIPDNDRYRHDQTSVEPVKVTLNVEEGGVGGGVLDTMHSNWTTSVRSLSGSSWNGATEKCEAALFSGQGYQHIGMGKDTVENVPAARELYRRASAVLGYDLLQLVMFGSEEILAQTNYSQPAILVASLAAVERMRQELGHEAFESKFCVSMGFSIGEYAALVFSGVMEFEEAVRLTQIRGEAMLEASGVSPQAMMSIDGPPTQVVEEVCRHVSHTSGKGVAIANFLAPTLNVISGYTDACKLVESSLKSSELHRVKRSRRLHVSGAFHSPFMSSASTKLAHALQHAELRPPRLPVVFNVDAQPHAEPSVIRKLLELQVSNPVQLEASLSRLLERGVRKGVEFGPTSGIGAVMHRVATSRGYKGKIRVTPCL